MTITAIQQGCQSMFHQAWNHVYHEGQKVVGEATSLVGKADSSLLQPAINLGKKYYPIAQELSQKVWSVAIMVMKAVIALILFATNTTFFMLGAAAAMVFPEQMRSAVDRISQVWNSLPGIFRFGIFFPLPFAWPSYFVIAAPFVGAYVSLFSQDTAGVVRSTVPQPQPAQPQPAIVAAKSTQTASPLSEEVIAAAFSTATWMSLSSQKVTREGN